MGIGYRCFQETEVIAYAVAAASWVKQQLWNVCVEAGGSAVNNLPLMSWQITLQAYA